MHAGQVVGVLAVQNRTARGYGEDEVEALQIIAIVLAEIVGGGQLVSPDELLETSGNVTLPQRLEGVPLAVGLADGQVVFHDPPIEVSQLVADDPDNEKIRLDQALSGLADAIDDLVEGAMARGGGEDSVILETYWMFSRDRGWRDRIDEAIRGGLTAEAAVQRVQVNTRERMSGKADPFFRERLQDLDDLSNRLLRHLTGATAASAMALPDNAVLVARTIGST